MEVTAKLRHFRTSPRKSRLVADTIRGLDVEIAQNELSFLNKRVAKPILKLLQSAIANAENNFQLKRNNLFIKEIRVDEGPVLKRWKPRAFGRAAQIKKRTSHITIILGERVETKIEEKKKKDVKKVEKDVKVVKDLDELKELEKEVDESKVEDDWGEIKTEEHKPEIKDVRREGSDRNKQHLDTVRKKEKGGGIKKFFRRKSI